MKNFLLIIRWIVGLLFIFSGLVKANDPLGLSYKMQEFFEVWGWHFLNDYTLLFAMLMNLFEIVAGVAVIIGWRMKLFSWLLLLLIIFFSFLTGYALFSGKIKTCGCFGDCLPLTPAQSFGKDLFLLVLILVLFVTAKRIKPVVKPFAAVVVLLIAMVTTAAGQFYVLKNLPFVDCLPYKKGNNLLEQMKTPEGAIPDSFSIVFTYKKNGKLLAFDQLHFPADFDSTYEYVDRKDKLVKKGNGLQPKILDFSLQTLSGTDTTQAVFEQTGKYLMILAKDMDHYSEWAESYAHITDVAKKKNLPVLLVTADADKSVALFPNTPIAKCDATVLKTAARVTPTYFIMQGATVLAKYSYTKEAIIVKELNQLP
ncbi:MAG: BT_3928 family protein [Bacteroidota bacterium]